ncbi:40586_t:CDS:2 [Gigaspora margarita]|uniref:40586_t:CDS:1 n=1 Tax=Gigaspora margarita TaxID=4874 RepID=A0ABN7V440_GIGMA|nr:40586_t:CDS:2 [Gigaspora margarita]
MVKACNPNMNRQNLMDTANNECLYNSNSSSSNSTVSPNYYANSLSLHLLSHLSNEESDLASNPLAQRQALNLIKEAKAKANEYECLLLNTSNKDLRPHIYEKLKDSHAIIERKKKHFKSLQSHAKSQAKLKEKNVNNLTKIVLNMVLQKKKKKNSCHHHHLAQIEISAISQSEMKPHVDEHYYLTLVKMVREFATTFASNSLIILQDDKAKISLGIPAVGRTFKSIQSLNEPVTVFDHDFSRKTKQKLIPLVYLIINPENTNETLRQGQLSIYIRLEYFAGTLSLSHMRDLIDISKCNDFVLTLNNGDRLKSIWILLVDGGPDKNPKHLKNIAEYCHLFRELDLDYLSVRIHAPYYQGVVINEELARHDFEFSGQHLYEIWRQPTTWLWIERHAQLCHYSFDLRKCSDRNCCNDVYAKEVVDLLKENNRILPLLTKGKDSHYLNLIHILQYIDKTKLPKYDEEYPSILSQTHQRLCCNICDKYFPIMKMITKHKQEIHTNQLCKKAKNQTFVHNFELPIILIENVSPSYFSIQEVIESLDNLDNDNYQVQLSNSNFIEDFSDLPSACPFQSNEVLDLCEALSDIE